MSLEVIKGLKPAQFRYKLGYGETTKYTLGVMAQDVEKFYPIEEFNVVQDKEGYLAVDYNQLIAPMIKAIQELSDKIEKLEEQLNEHSL